MVRTIYGSKNNNATYEGMPVLMVARWGLNGIKYVWLYPSQEKVDELIMRYGAQEWGDGAIKQSDGTYTRCDCLWLYTY